MKIYKCDRKSVKWYKKINYLVVFLIIAISIPIFMLIFNIFDNGDNINSVIRHSIIVTFLILLDYISRQLLENRDKVFLVKGNKVSYIGIHDSRDGKFLSDKEYYDMLNETSPSEIYKNLEKYSGIDRTDIIEVLKARKKCNGVKLVVKICSKEWKARSFFSSDIYLVDKEYNKKIFIPKDYEKYDELCNILLKNMPKIDK
ncbi:MAG: hypothetical protein IJ568_00660 [Bacilli bacterium]|nr:hypothetical protein [Bacilli bacterium]